MKADIFLSTRNKSTRLPGKVLFKIKGKTVTDHLFDRLKTVKNASQLIFCTSTNSNDDPLIEIAKNNHIEFFRGSADDKLDRYLNAARKFDTDFIAIVDGDDVFCEPAFIDICVEKFKKTRADYISIKGAPVGTVPFCIKRQALEKVCSLKNERDTEVWGTAFTESGLFDVLFVKVPDPKLCRPDIRLTLDYREDFLLIEKIFDVLYRPGQIISLHEIIDLLTEKPELLNINKHVHKLYLQHQERSPKITLKGV